MTWRARLLGAWAIAIGSIVAHGCARANNLAGGYAPGDSQEADAATGFGVDAFAEVGPLGPRPDASDPLLGCATATADVTRDPIYMLIVLDGSGSMNDEAKWTAVVPSLGYFFDDLEQQADPSFGVGLTIFSDANDPTKGVGPYPSMDVPIAFVSSAQASALHARLDAALPRGPTPTLAVLSGQYAALESFAPASPLLANGKRVVVLMTDGVPYPDADNERPKCVQAAKDEVAKGAPLGPVTTFAIGIGHFFPYDPTTYDPDFMGDLAMAGGAPNDGCIPHERQNVQRMCHFQVTPASIANAVQLEHDFKAAFDRIRSEVTSCALTLVREDGGGPIDPTKVNVVFTSSTDGERTVLAEDPQNGWTYDDPNAPSQVILHGSACGLLKNDPDGEMRVVLGCKTIVK